MRHARGMADPADENPAVTGGVTFVSFILFGSIPLIPYFVADPTETTFRLSVAATATALALLGVLRWRVTGDGALRAVGETMLIGGVCALVAYAVGLAFRG
jgi:VIT1/CCC1 family predicted Fe2+/Mn2+ transporter